MDDILTESFLAADNGNEHINTKTISELLKIRSNNLFRPHKTEFNIIFLFEDSRGKIIVDFNSIDVMKNHLLFVSQNQIIQFGLPVDCKGRVLIFTEDFFCGNNPGQTQFFGQTTLFNEPVHLPYFNVKDSIEEVATLFRLVRNELGKAHYKEQSTILNNYLFNLLLLSENLYDGRSIQLETTDHRLLISKFKSLVNRNLYEQHSLEFYVKNLNVSLRTLQTAFLQEEKQTPKQWLINRMVLEIKRNLTYRSLSISEIAYSLGFKEVTNFTKFFKSKTDLTPSQFRNLLGK